MADETEYLKDQAPLNELQYASKDFPTYFDALLRLIREQYGADYNDFGSSSVGVLLTHITAYGLSQMSWYLDRTANDCYLDTARTLSTVTRLARQIGYKPNPAAASTADLTLTFASTAAPSSIASGFRFQGPSGLVFQATNAVLVPAGSTSAIVNVTEGDQKTLNFTGTGLPNQNFNLTGVNEGKYVADLSVRVWVNGLEWTEQDFLTFAATNQFEASYTTNPPFIIFGDGFAGNIPSIGAAIHVEYRVINGSGGNVKSNTITSAIDTFSVSGNPVSLTVNNPQGSSGGAEPESISQIKINAPRNYLSRGAAITQEDYITLAQSYSDPTYGSVSVAYADVIRDQGVDATTQVLIQELDDEIGAFATSFAAQDTVINNNIALSTAASASIVGGAAVITSANASLATEITTIQSSVTNGIGQTAIVMGNGTEISSLAADALAAISAANYPLATTKLNQIVVLATTTIVAGFSANGAFGTIQAATETQTTLLTTQTAAAASLTTLSANLLTYLSAIDGALVLINTAEGTLETDFTATRIGLENHLSGLFSADCEANLVNVPILVTNSEGFYAAPSSGLISAIQTYLNGIKDVTHEVSVISGYPLLVFATIQIYVSYNPAFVESEILANITFGVDSVLKGRQFATPLYLSDLYSITDQIAGIDHINIEITGPSARLDTLGNLIPQQLEIITKGSVTITKV
jgi:hypothetical protein